jgi:hypothetical protein
MRQGRIDEGILGDEHTIFDMTDPAAAENLKAIGYEPQEGSAFVAIKKKHDGEEIPMFFQDEDEILEFYNKGVGQYEALRGAKHSEVDVEFSKTWRSEDDVLAYPFIDPVKYNKIRTDLDEDQLSTIFSGLYDPSESDAFVTQFTQAGEEVQEFIKENIKPVSKDVVRRVRMSANKNNKVWYHANDGGIEGDGFDNSRLPSVDPDAPFNAHWFSHEPSSTASYRGSGNTITPVTLEGGTAASWEDVKRVQKKLSKQAEENRQKYLEVYDKEGLDKANALGLKIDDQGSTLREALVDEGYDYIVFRGREPINAKELDELGETTFVNNTGLKHKLKWETVKVRGEEYPSLELYDARVGHVTGYTDLDDFERAFPQEEAVAVFNPDIIKFKTETYSGKFLRGSTVKIPVFRATTGDEPTTDLLVAIQNPREMGVHVGANAGQANVIARPGSQKFMKNLEGDVPTMSRQEFDEMNANTDPEQMYGSALKEEKPITKGIEPERFTKGIAPKSTISEYYINIKNPLKMSRDIGRWDAESIVPYMKQARKAPQPVKVVRDMSRKLNYYDEFGAEGNEAMDKVNLYVLAKLTNDDALDSLKSQLKNDYIDVDHIDEMVDKYSKTSLMTSENKRGVEFLDAIEENLGRKLTNEEWDKLDNIYVPDEPILEAEVLDDVVNQAGIYKSNRQFREWLQDLGFDSIEYKNTGEASFEGADQRSWIIFDHSQIKSARAESFDITDPRVSKAMGGLVRNRDKYAQGGMVPMPPEVMQPEAQEIVNPPLNQSNLQLGDESVAGMGTGLIMRSLKRRFR